MFRNKRNVMLKKLDVFTAKRKRIQDFPTPVSPIRTNLKRRSL
jgi:hypothetical protein